MYGSSLSLIIPALDAAPHLSARLPGLVAAVRMLGAEVLVVDGGSRDATARVAEAAGARVIAAPRGRGSQLAAGVAAAGGDWLLLLHADTQPADGWVEAVAAFMGDPAQAGCAAYFRFAVDDPGPEARRLERLVAWRCRRLGLPYGDQGLLIHRRTLAAVGGIRPLPLMEDVDLVRRIGRARLVGLPVAAVTSAERFRQDGYLGRSARNLGCLALWWIGVPAGVVARLYGGVRRPHAG